MLKNYKLRTRQYLFLLKYLTELQYARTLF